MKVSGFKYLVGQGVENIWKNRMMAFASFCVLLVSLLLVGMSVLFYMNLTSMIGGVEDKNEVIIYMDEGTTDQQLADFQSELSQIKNISSITFYSKEQAFEDLKNSMSDYEVLFDSLGDDNPLIDGYRIRIDDISQISTTIAQIEQLDHIYSIRAPMDFVNDRSPEDRHRGIWCHYCGADRDFRGHRFQRHKGERVRTPGRNSDHEVCWCDQRLYSYPVLCRGYDYRFVCRSSSVGDHLVRI